MPAKKPAKPTRLQVKADKKDKVLTGPKGSKPQSTTTNRVRTQGGKPTVRTNVTVTPSMDKGRLRVPGTEGKVSKPAPSAGRRVNPKAAKPKPAPKPAAKPATPSGGGRNLFGGAGDKKAAIAKADGQKAPKPAFRTSRAPLSGNGPFGTRRSARPSLGNVKPGPAAAAAPRQQAQAQGQANVRAAQQRRENLARVQRDLRGQVGKATALLGGLRGGAFQAIAESVAPRPTAKGTLSGGGAQGPAMPKRLEQQGLAAQERRARKALDARKKATGSKEATPNTAASFDDAFRDARRAKVKTFTWRGKKYTTEMK
jgi:hypothetical protein